MNNKGTSEFSNEIATTTKVNKIPPPKLVTFDPSSRTLGINVDPTCLALIAIVESIVNSDTPMAAWQIVDRIELTVSGNRETHRETIIEHLATARRSTGRSLGVHSPDHEDITSHLDDELNPRVRVKLCLRTNTDHCGDYTDAQSKYFVFFLLKFERCYYV